MSLRVAWISHCPVKGLAVRQLDECELTEEAEAIGWYEQRIALEPDAQAKAIMENAQGEEFKHFGMDLEFLIRRTPKWKIALQTILFTDGDIVEKGEKAEELENS